MRGHSPERRKSVILVAGTSRATEAETRLAEEVGRLLADAGAVVLTGGGGGVMEAASRGARRAGGTTIAVLPGSDAYDSPPNAHVEIPIYTGMGEARNVVLVKTADAAIAIGGGWGTLSEIALARKVGRPVVRLRSWKIHSPDEVVREVPPSAQSAPEAVEMALAAARTS